MPNEDFANIMDAISEEAPTEEPLTEEVHTEEVPVEEEQIVEEHAEESESQGQNVDENWQSRYNALEEKFDALTSLLKERLDVPNKTPDKVEPQEMKPVEFIATEEEWEEATSSRDKFNNVLNKVATNIIEELLKVLPATADVVVRRQQEQQQIVSDFYNRNPHLKEHGELVKFYMNQVEQQMPGKSHLDIIAEAEKRLNKVVPPKGGTTQKSASIGNRTVANTTRNIPKATTKVNPDFAAVLDYQRSMHENL